MSMTEFDMVQELASLIKDNLYSKHLVLSTEEAFISLLEDGTSGDGIIELQPMSSYHRVLVHRLADIFGFFHESIGEGDARHIVLQCSADTAIPPILVSDVLWEYGEYLPTMPSNHILGRKEAPAPPIQPIQTNLPPTSLEEREVAYQAARQRIFSLHNGNKEDVPRSRSVPTVARRMIAHALGQKMGSPIRNHSLNLHDDKEISNRLNGIKLNEEQSNSSLEKKESSVVAGSKLDSHERNEYHRPPGRRKSYNGTLYVKKGQNKPVAFASYSRNTVPNEGNRRIVTTESLEKQQIGAAKRIFANALGLSSGRGNADLALKSEERIGDNGGGM